MRKSILIVSVLSLVFLNACLDEPTAQRSFEEQLAIDIDLIETYLAENELTATRHSSGIYYVIHNEGGEKKPTLQDVVEVTYTGKLLSNVVFDSNDQGVEFFLGQLIASWQIMIPLIGEGGRMTIYAPSVYCYGSNPIANIPANSCLIFNFELLEINP